MQDMIIMGFELWEKLVLFTTLSNGQNILKIVYLICPCYMLNFRIALAHLYRVIYRFKNKFRSMTYGLERLALSRKQKNTPL